MPTRSEQLAQHARRVTAAVAFWIVAVLFVADVSLLSGWLLAQPAGALPVPAEEASASPSVRPSPSPQPSASPSPAEAPTDDPEVLLDGDATVTFPSAPSRSDRFVEIEGEDVALSLHTMTDDDETTYSLAVIEYPASVDVSDPAVNLLSSVSGAAGSVGGQVTSQDVYVFDGVPAADFEIETPTVRLRARNVLAGRRLYSQTVAYNGDTPPAQADAFFDSFELPDP